MQQCTQCNRKRTNTNPGIRNSVRNAAELNIRVESILNSAPPPLESAVKSIQGASHAYPIKSKVCWWKGSQKGRSVYYQYIVINNSAFGYTHTPGRFTNTQRKYSHPEWPVLVCATVYTMQQGADQHQSWYPQLCTQCSRIDFQGSQYHRLDSTVQSYNRVSLTHTKFPPSMSVSYVSTLDNTPGVMMLI